MVLPVYGLFPPLPKRPQKRGAGQGQHPHQLLGPGPQRAVQRRVHLWLACPACPPWGSRAWPWPRCSPGWWSWPCAWLTAGSSPACGCGPACSGCTTRCSGGDFIRYSLPALGNEFAWGLAYSMYSVIMGAPGRGPGGGQLHCLHHAQPGLGAGLWGGQRHRHPAGKSIGSGDMGRAEQDARRLLWLTFAASLLGSVLVLCSYPVNTSVMTTLNPPGGGVLAGYGVDQCGVCHRPAHEHLLDLRGFRAGGDSKFGFICDVVCMWCVAVPLGFLAAFVLRLPPMWGLLRPQLGRVLEDACGNPPLPEKDLAAQHHQDIS